MEFTQERRREGYNYSHKEVEENEDTNPNTNQYAFINASTSSTPTLTEKEHMFDKVVTPSDVGKLNRLVIPKQHAEKYFPLDTSTHEKGLILNFEDRTGKPWRFRYSYWNSSQSYVMTKGWSRFVKEKRLDAGDTVSFIRAVNEKDRFFIDWKPRPEMINVPQRMPMQINPVNYPMLSFGLPLNYMYNAAAAYSGAGSSGQYLYFRSALGPQRPSVQLGVGTSPSTSTSSSSAPIVSESLPVVQNPAAPKRVRLFGVNLDEESRRGSYADFSSSASPSPKEKERSEYLSLDLEM